MAALGRERDTGNVGVRGTEPAGNGAPALPPAPGLFVTARLGRSAGSSEMDEVGRFWAPPQQQTRPLQRPRAARLFGAPWRGSRYALEVEGHVNATGGGPPSELSLVWDRTGVPGGSEISFFFLEPWRSPPGSCPSRPTCPSCLADLACGWCPHVAACLDRLATPPGGGACAAGGEEAGPRLVLSPGNCVLCEEHRDCRACAADPLCEWQEPESPSGDFVCSRRGRRGGSIRDPQRCPPPCSERPTCAQCLAPPSPCAWCRSTQRCFFFSSYLAKYPYGGCRAWVDSVHSPPGCEQCEQFRSCSQCLRRLECGWCGRHPERGRCLQGDFSGPWGGANCSGGAWAYGRCPSAAACGHEGEQCPRTCAPRTARRAPAAPPPNSTCDCDPPPTEPDGDAVTDTDPGLRLRPCMRPWGPGEEAEAPPCVWAVSVGAALRPCPPRAPCPVLRLRLRLEPGGGCDGSFTYVFDGLPALMEGGAVLGDPSLVGAFCGGGHPESITIEARSGLAVVLRSGPSPPPFSASVLPLPGAELRRRRCPPGGCGESAGRGRCDEVRANGEREGGEGRGLGRGAANGEQGGRGGGGAKGEGIGNPPPAALRPSPSGSCLSLALAPGAEPSQCPSPCGNRSACGECLGGGGAACAWSVLLRQCLSPELLPLFCGAGACGRLLWEAPECDGGCEGAPHCVSCLRLPHCGWCGGAGPGTGRCLQGGLQGPRDGPPSECLSWSFLRCPPEDDCGGGGGAHVEESMEGGVSDVEGGVANGDGGVVNGDGGVVNGDGGVVNGDGGVVNGDGGVVNGDGGVVNGDGAWPMVVGVPNGDGGVANGDGDGGVANGDGGVVNGDGGVVNGDGGVVNGDGGVANGDGGVANGHGGVANGDGGVANGDGGVANGDGGVVNGDGGVANGDGGVANGDGGVANGCGRGQWNVGVASLPCAPSCPGGCGNGSCAAPGRCRCPFGSVGPRCGVACACNGHGHCPGPGMRQRCSHCRHNTQLLSWVSEGPPEAEAVCVGCREHSAGPRCGRCLPGYFLLHGACTRCQCNGHADTCNEADGTGCPCANNTESAACTGDRRECYRHQCTRCRDSFQGHPAGGQPCYRLLAVEHEHCLDPGPASRCFPLLQRRPLPPGATVPFGLQPKFTNVDVRVTLDVTYGVVDLYAATSYDTFVLRHRDGAAEVALADNGTAVQREGAGAGAVTYVTAAGDGALVVAGVRNRLVLTYPHRRHALRSARFYLLVRSSGTGTGAIGSGSLSSSSPPINPGPGTGSSLETDTTRSSGTSAIAAAPEAASEGRRKRSRL
ncbi:multiple epidermal growth factor-like domains protein 8 [Guaruba guarouba]